MSANRAYESLAAYLRINGFGPSTERPCMGCLHYLQRPSRQLRKRRLNPLTTPDESISLCISVCHHLVEQSKVKKWLFESYEGDVSRFSTGT